MDAPRAWSGCILARDEPRAVAITFSLRARAARTRSRPKPELGGSVRIEGYEYMEGGDVRCAGYEPDEGLRLGGHC